MVTNATPIVNGPRWDGAAAGFEALGEPWATYGRLLIAEDDARAREQTAATRGDVDAKERAARDRLDAQEEIQRFRQHHTSWLLRVLAWAVEDNPSALAAILDPAYRKELDVTQTSIVDTEDRIDKLEDAVVTLEAQEAP